QEALTNVMRHANASQATVSLEARAERIVLIVRDNGRGLAASDVNGSTNGLAGMRERALLVGGAFRVQSQLGGGTEVTLDVPLTSSCRESWTMVWDLASAGSSSPSSPVRAGSGSTRPRSKPTVDHSPGTSH